MDSYLIINFLYIDFDFFRPCILFSLRVNFFDWFRMVLIPFEPPTSGISATLSENIINYGWFNSSQDSLSGHFLFEKFLGFEFISILVYEFWCFLKSILIDLCLIYILNISRILVELWYFFPIFEALSHFWQSGKLMKFLQPIYKKEVDHEFFGDTTNTRQIVIPQRFIRWPDRHRRCLTAAAGPA